jgi:hypothetical protein
MDIDDGEEEKFTKKMATLAYLLNLMKNCQYDKGVLEKTSKSLEEIDVILNMDKDITFNEFAINYSNNISNILKDCYVLKEGEGFEIPNPKMCKYSDHIDYWREACFILDELPCSSNKGVCEFEQDCHKIIKHKFRLRNFLPYSQKCIYCYFKIIARQYKINLILNGDEDEVPDVICLNPHFCYFFDSNNEYPNSYLLTQYEKGDFFGISGEGGIPDVKIEQLKFYEYKKFINERIMTLKGVIHNFVKI